MAETETLTRPNELDPAQVPQPEVILPLEEQTNPLTESMGRLMLEGEMNSQPEGVESPGEKTTFVDSRGVERGPNPLAAEVILTPEIEETIDEHFEGVYAALPEIDKRLAELEAQVSAPEKVAVEQSSEPLDKAFIKEIKESTRIGIENSWEKDNPSVITTRGELTEFEKAKIAGLDSAESGADAKEALQKVTKDLLLGGRDINDEPILVKRILQSGRDVEDLDMDMILELVPEMSPIIEVAPDVKQRVETESGVANTRADTKESERLLTAVDGLRKEIEALLPHGELRISPDEILPSNNELLSTIYYNESDLAEVGQRYSHLKALETIIDARHAERSESTDELLNKARNSIETFFTRAYNADELMLHATPSAPRIIKDGFLRPAASMNDSEFLSNTVPNNSRASGRSALHFASRADRTFLYDGNNDGTPMGGGGTQEEEVARAEGGLGKAVFGIRLGDIVEQAPFQATGLSGDMGGGGPEKLIKIQLTQEGYEKVVNNLKTQHENDIYFTSAPGKVASEVAYDYAFPVKDAMVAVASKSAENVQVALRQAGRSEDDIAEHALFYTGANGGDDEIYEALQRRADEEGKYANQVVVKLRREE